jgi:DNA-binding response OmpR family regulator
MPAAPPKNRVLVVDDSPLVLELLGAALGSAGFIVDTAIDLRTLEERRAAAPPDLIVLDVQMPEAWGDDVAATLRHAYGVTVPIILMSTLEESELARRAKEARVDGFVSKRYGVDRVVERITELMKTHGAAPS